jgi:hypothetical protein
MQNREEKITVLKRKITSRKGLRPAMEDAFCQYEINARYAVLGVADGFSKLDKRGRAVADTVTMKTFKFLAPLLEREKDAQTALLKLFEIIDEATKDEYSGAVYGLALFDVVHSHCYSRRYCDGHNIS